MKTILTVLAIFAVSSLASHGQETKPAADKPKQELSTDAKTSASPSATTKPKPQVTLTTPPKATKRHSIWRGVFPQAGKADNPLQLINPFAPASYGDGSNNAYIDPITGKARGIKAASLEF
jgi:hypothetical protein